ncbi:hypothetical protein [Sinorhizobium phage phiM5]|nr:hypothetical protein [Sinorhizobium phage phiM5]
MAEYLIRAIIFQIAMVLIAGLAIGAGAALGVIWFLFF